MASHFWTIRLCEILAHVSYALPVLTSYNYISSNMFPGIEYQAGQWINCCFSLSAQYLRVIGFLLFLHQSQNMQEIFCNIMIFLKPHKRAWTLKIIKIRICSPTCEIFCDLQLMENMISFPPPVMFGLKVKYFPIYSSAWKYCYLCVLSLSVVSMDIWPGWITAAG